MPEVTLEVAGRNYRVRCGDGEEDQLSRMAGRIDAEAQNLVSATGQMPEGRLMLMTALIMADKLDETERALREAERRIINAEKIAADQPDPARVLTPEREAQIVSNLDALSERIEALAGRIEGRG